MPRNSNVETAIQKIGHGRLVGLAVLAALALAFLVFPLSWVRNAADYAKKYPSQPLLVTKIEARDWKGTPTEVKAFNDEVAKRNTQFKEGDPLATPVLPIFRNLLSTFLVLAMGWIIVECLLAIRREKDKKERQKLAARITTIFLIAVLSALLILLLRLAVIRLFFTILIIAGLVSLALLILSRLRKRPTSIAEAEPAETSPEPVNLADDRNFEKIKSTEELQTAVNNLIENLERQQAEIEKQLSELDGEEDRESKNSRKKLEDQQHNLIEEIRRFTDEDEAKFAEMVSFIAEVVHAYLVELPPVLEHPTKEAIENERWQRLFIKPLFRKTEGEGVFLEKWRILAYYQVPPLFESLGALEIIRRKAKNYLDEAGRKLAKEEASSGAPSAPTPILATPTPATSLPTSRSRRQEIQVTIVASGLILILIIFGLLLSLLSRDPSYFLISTLAAAVIMVVVIRFRKMIKSSTSVGSKLLKINLLPKRPYNLIRAYRWVLRLASRILNYIIDFFTEPR